MKTSKLIELYGRRFTASASIAGFIAILIFGVLIAFGTTNGRTTQEENTRTEQPAE